MKIACMYRYKQWVDELSQLFAGLDVCAIEAVQGKDGQQYILDVRIVPVPARPLPLPIFLLHSKSLPMSRLWRLLSETRQLVACERNSTYLVVNATRLS